MSSRTPNDDVIYEFGGCRMDPRRRQLTRNGRAVAMFPRCFDALLLLVERRGELLDKDFLLGELWPDVIVDENNLAKVISEVRRALGDGGRGAQCILTVPRRGYQFGADVKLLRRDDLADRQVAVDAADRGEIRSLAVLPFTFMNETAGSDYLGLGLADALITRLGHLRRTGVRPTASVVHFATSPISPVAAGRALQVDAVITGTIRQVGALLRVSVQLISVRGESLLWAEKFDTRVAGALELEDSIAERVAGALTLALAREERPPRPRQVTANSEAYEHFVRGRYLNTKRTREAMDEAVRCFERATSLDPTFALAYAGLGETWVNLGIRAAVTQSCRPRDVMPKARAAAEKALELDDTLSDAHGVFGHVLVVYEWQREAGLASLRRAIELNPNNQRAHHWYGMALSGLGRFDDGLAQLEVARSIDPLSVIVNANIGFVLYQANRLDQAVEKLRHTVAMEPTFVMSRYRLGLALEAQGNYDEAIEQFELMRPDADQPLGLTAIARTRALMGEADESRRMLGQLVANAQTAYVPSAMIADIHIALGEHERALEWLERAIDERALAASWLPWARHWNPLRTYPKFAELLRRAGFSAP